MPATRSVVSKWHILISRSGRCVQFEAGSWNMLKWPIPWLQLNVFFSVWEWSYDLRTLGTLPRAHGGTKELPNMYCISFGLVCHLRHCVVLPNDCLTLLAFLGWVQFHQRGLKCQKPSKSAAWSPWKDGHNGLLVVGPTGAGPHLQLLQLIFHFYTGWDQYAIPAFHHFDFFSMRGFTRVWNLDTPRADLHHVDGRWSQLHGWYMLVPLRFYTNWLTPFTKFEIQLIWISLACHQSQIAPVESWTLHLGEKCP